MSSTTAALARESALRAHRILQGADHPIQIAVNRHRHVAPVPGYRVRRIAHFEAGSRWNLSPPRLTVEDAALDVASDASTDFAAFEVLAEVCRSRHSTPRRLAMAANDRARLRRKKRLLAVLDDLGAGACSVLERGYLRQVERGHGLPAPHRQSPVASSKGSRYRDVDYPTYGLVVELDGRMFHDSPAARDRDLDRDLATAVLGRATVRLGWGQVFDRTCETAGRIGELLQRLGWDGAPRRCGSECRL